MSTGAHFEDDLGSLIVVNSGDLEAAAGWNILAGSVNKVGPAVMLHLEFGFAAAAAALALTLPEDLRPSFDVHTADGKFVIATDGTITYTGSTTAADAGPVVCEAVYDPRRSG